MRRKVNYKKEKVPDVKFKSVVVGRFINYLMKDGKKSTAESIMYDCFDLIKKETKQEPMQVFEKALENAAPAVEVASKRVGGANYQVPREVRADRKFILACRWIIEDYHQCLKTGCGIEERDFEEVVAVERLLGLLGPLAARLLQLRDCARLTPELPASTVVDELTVQLVAAERGVAATGMSVRAFWRHVAAMGGFLGRKRDGEPGWKSLWAGWLRVEAMVHGARLARSFGWC